MHFYVNEQMLQTCMFQQSLIIENTVLQSQYPCHCFESHKFSCCFIRKLYMNCSMPMHKTSQWRSKQSLLQWP